VRSSHEAATGVPCRVRCPLAPIVSSATIILLSRVIRTSPDFPSIACLFLAPAETLFYTPIIAGASPSIRGRPRSKRTVNVLTRDQSADRRTEPHSPVAARSAGVRRTTVPHRRRHRCDHLRRRRHPVLHRRGRRPATLGRGRQAARPAL